MPGILQIWYTVGFEYQVSDLRFISKHKYPRQYIQELKILPPLFQQSG